MLVPATLACRNLADTSEILINHVTSPFNKLSDATNPYHRALFAAQAYDSSLEISQAVLLRSPGRP